VTLASRTVPPAVALAAASGILAAGGIASLTVLLLAAVAAATYGDLARRACREPGGPGDPTDLATAVTFFMILAAAAYELGRLSASHLQGRSGWMVYVAGIALIVVGLIVRASAARTLGPDFAVRLGTRPEQALVRSGPYRWLRHPNYTGLLAVALGTAAAFGSALALAATLLLWLPTVIVRMAREERLLVARFGESYREYAAHTWRLVPGIY
jgi:protein-S-isoprenylcysteine O-methyltransferase Ste14